MKKEKELAERRKNDPALNQTQDHIVRKLFSKFRRAPSGDVVGAAPASDRSGRKAAAGGGGGDIERGAGGLAELADNNGIPPGSL